MCHRLPCSSDPSHTPERDFKISPCDLDGVILPNLRKLWNRKHVQFELPTGYEGGERPPSQGVVHTLSVWPWTILQIIAA